MHHDTMRALADRLAEHFATWDLTLPDDSVRAGGSGHIQQRGWHMQYAFGKDDSGTYLDYYASHRMTEDIHCRMYADGRTEHLPATASMHLSSEDPDEARRLAEEHFRRNREVAAMLVAKGFSRFGINALLRMGLMEDESGEE